MLSHLPAFLGAALQFACQMANVPELLMIGRFVQGINCGEWRHIITPKPTQIFESIKNISRKRYWFFAMAVVVMAKSVAGVVYDARFCLPAQPLMSVVREWAAQLSMWCLRSNFVTSQLRFCVDFKSMLLSGVGLCRRRTVTSLNWSVLSCKIGSFSLARSVGDILARSRHLNHCSLQPSTLQFVSFNLTSCLSTKQCNSREKQAFMSNKLKKDSFQRSFVSLWEASLYFSMLGKY